MVKGNEKNLAQKILNIFPSVKSSDHNGFMPLMSSSSSANKIYSKSELLWLYKGWIYACCNL